MRKAWRKQLMMIGAAGLAAAAMWGCSGSSEPAKTTAAPAATTAAAETKAAETEAAESKAETEAAAAEIAWPEKDVQCIVPQAAGGGTDALARAVATPLEGEIGKPIVIINNGSAGGMVGMEEIAGAEADGYTLGVFSNTDVANFVFTSEGCEFGLDDFTYIAGLNATGDILIMKKDSPYKTIEDFIAYAKENPGKMTIALPSPIQNLSLNLLNQALEIETTGVVYEGGNKVFADLVGGHIEAGILSAKFISQAAEQDMSVFGLMLDERLETFPDTPTFIEQGYQISNPAVRMLVGPKGMPQEIVEKIQSKLEICYEGAARDGLLTIGECPVLKVGTDLDEFLKEDFAMRERLLK